MKVIQPLCCSTDCILGGGGVNVFDSPFLFVFVATTMILNDLTLIFIR